MSNPAPEPLAPRDGVAQGPTAPQHDARPPAAPGSGRFAQFRILGSLGGGGMGDVYLAFDERLQRRVALKLIRPESLWSTDAKARFHRETLAVGRLDHPGICRLYEAGEHDGWPFMALQHLEGETLAQRIDAARAACAQRGEPPSASAPATREAIVAVVELCEQVARALHHAHERGLVHRDIKPANVMVGVDGRPVVLDFGLVHDQQSLEASLSSSRRGVGTPLYMAPEQVRCAGEADARTDVYSLGVTLYECLTHERPFDAATEAELADEILANVYVDPRRRNPHLPPELSLVLACALDRDPARRYRTALALAEDLRCVVLLQPVRARPIGALLRLRRWAQRNPTLIAVGLLAGMALLGLVFAARNALRAGAQQAVASAREGEARANLDMFLLVADTVQLQDAKASEQRLYPAFPEKAQAMRDWLREHAALPERLPRYEKALGELHEKAKPSPREQRLAHPRYEELQRLAARLAWAERSLDLRAGKAQVRVPEVDAETAKKTAADLETLAANLVFKPEQLPASDQAAFALACARLALSKSEAGDATIERSSVLHTLAWALYHNGQDAEALLRHQESIDRGSADSQQRRFGLGLLEEAVADWQGDTWPARIRELRAEIAELDLEISTTFEDGGDRFLHTSLRRLVDELRVFGAEKGELAAVRRRLVEAESEPKRSIEDHRSEWDAAIAAIASSDGDAASRLYDHLVLRPQVGLVPIGKDPDSGLWEFAHLASGAIARRHPRIKRLVNTDDTGIVFVLLPGGTFTIGQTAAAITLAPFFLSKYEMTQGQWLRLTGGETPSMWGPGVRKCEHMTLVHPVEQVDWAMCDSLMRKHGLCLPTEAQWEFGARGGTAAAPTREAPHANPASLDWTHVEVGGFPPNGFGLHDIVGNVGEWCRDWWADYRSPVRSEDGLRYCRPSDQKDRVARGHVPPITSRKGCAPTLRGEWLGLRPARVLVR